MDKYEIASMLPIFPRSGMEAAVRENCANELGPDVCLYHRVSSLTFEDGGFLGWPEFDGPEPKSHWAAECRCGVCGGVFHGGWLKGGDGVLIAEGPDGTLYPGATETGVKFLDGEDMICPCCDASVRLLPKKKLSHGRTYRIMVGSLENVGAYTAILVWMAERYVCSDGDAYLTIGPESAAVIDDNGGLQFFSFKDGAWIPRQSNADPFQRIYLSYDGAMNRKAGVWLWPDVPEQRGQTGEKTGIADYFRGRGQWPVMYLRFWRAYPHIENLLKAGWMLPIEQSIDEEVLDTLRRASEVYSAPRKLFSPSDLICLCDWEAARPCDMLGMTRQEVREGASWRWEQEMLMLWVGCVDQRIAFPGDAAFMEQCRQRYGIGSLQKWADMASEANTPASLYEIDRYLLKQQARHGLPIAAALVMYLDYWELLDDADPAPEQVWPPNLRAAHDRVVMSRAAENDKKYLKGFVCVCREWGALEWSDGQICAVLPRCNNDLVAEGKTLHHCVGGYGGQHVAGKLIIFIRHARRPERSWFTLNIDTTGQKWSEVQLHGYGNEFAHGKHLSIPKEVRAFVDRWEKEILTPVFRKAKAQRRDAEAEPQAAERPRLRAGGAA